MLTATAVAKTATATAAIATKLRLFPSALASIIVPYLPRFYGRIPLPARKRRQL
jgi:hypothetical protein